jgi:hypothetical protein
MVSQGGEEGMVDKGQASPRGVPSIAVREEGQMGARPSMRTCQRVGRMTIGMEEAWVVGCWMR